MACLSAVSNTGRRPQIETKRRRRRSFLDDVSLDPFVTLLEPSERERLGWGTASYLYPRREMKTLP